MLSTLEWRDLGALVAVSSGVGGMVIWWVRAHLLGTFASRADADSISARLAALETRMGTVPTQENIRALGERVSALEKGVAVVGTELRGLGDAMGRLERAVSAGFERQERQLHLLTENELRGK